MTDKSKQINTDSAVLVSKLLSLESEKIVICAALSESRSTELREISSQLLPSDFHTEAHQHLWRCRSSLIDSGAAHDVTAVMDMARKLNLFFGGVEYVLSLATDEALASSSEAALRAAGKRIKDFSILRSIRDNLQAALTLAESGAQTHEAIMSYVSDGFENIRAMNLMRATGPVHIMQYVDKTVELAAQRLDGQAPNSIVSTSFPELDKITGGLSDGDLVVIAARPSMGKTAISLAISEGISNPGDEGRDVLYFSTEQYGVALANRMVASNARIDASSMRRGEFTDNEFGRMLEGATAISGLTLWIDDTSEITLPEIKARARIWAQKRKPGRKIVIMIDYLQRITSHRQGERNVDPKQIVSEISTGLKNLAKELKCPLVALAQLNRECEKRANKRPMLSDLGESGKIEQDADVIMFMYRDEYYNNDTREPGIVELITAKNREGAVGVVKLGFEKRTQKFTSTNSYD